MIFRSRCSRAVTGTSDSLQIVSTYIRPRETGRQLGVVAFDRRRRISNRFLPVGEDDHLLSMDLSPDGKTVAVGTGWERIGNSSLGHG
jgi:hypothetical protein